MSCWSCRGNTPDDAPFCAICGVIQAPGQADHFRRLGLERRYDIDAGAVERAYIALQRRLHPDRFATKSSRERALSQSQATSLNEAYETLRHPLPRAVYLLRLNGIEIERSDGKTVDDPGLLLEAIEMREALATSSTEAEVDRLVAEARGRAESCRRDLVEAFAGGDLAAAHRLTLRFTYLTKLVDEARTRRLRVAQGAA
jgi:molecular chaperone HscB